MKKIVLVMITLMMSASLWAYSGDKAIGANINFTSDTTDNTVTENKDNDFYMSIMYSMMYKPDFEIAPYVFMTLNSDKTDGNFNSGLREFGIGAKFNFHMIQKEVISLALGLDPWLGFGSMPDDVNPDYSSFRIAVGFPVTMDINFSENWTLRLEKTIATVGYSNTKDRIAADSKEGFFWLSSYSAGLDDLYLGFMYSF